MRKSFLILPVLALAACEPAVPNSGAGVGFGDYQEYLAQREAQLQGQPKAPPLLASGSGYSQTAAAPPVPAAAGGYGAPLNATNLSTTAPAAVPATGDGSIGSDAMAALRATAPGGAAPAAAPAAPAMTVPTVPMAAPAAPMVSGSAGPNLAAYALNASNAPGQAVWPRGGLKLTNSEKACAKYVSPDLAQMAFLERGGPQKDPGNLDPDGDGFACGWDPRPFQAARR